MKINDTATIKINKKDFIQYLIAIILLCAAFILSIGVGRYPIPIKDIIRIIFGGEVDSTVRMVFFNLRLPRTIMVVIAGIGLITLHDPNMALNYCDKIIILKDNKKFADFYTDNVNGEFLTEIFTKIYGEIEIIENKGKYLVVRLN